MHYERHDIVVVPFPFTDRTSSIRRPALVLSDAEGFGAATGQCLLAMITRAARSTWPNDVPLTNIAPTGLTQGGVVRMKLFTLDQSLLLRRLGRIGAADQAKVTGALIELLGL